MNRIQHHERRLDSTVECSAHPLRHRMLERVRPAPTTASTSRSNRRNKATVTEVNSRFLPAHYFDYIGGTSTGGYDIPFPKKSWKEICWDRQIYRHHASSLINDRGGMLSSVWRSRRWYFWPPEIFSYEKYDTSISSQIWSCRAREYHKKMVANHDRFGNPDAIIAQRFPAMCRT